MRKTYALLKPRIAALTLLVASIVMVYSCKKNIEQNEQNDVISQLETTFNGKKVNGFSLAGKFADAGLNLNWKNAIIKKNRANKPLIIVPLQNTTNFYAEMDMVLSKGSVNSIVKKYTLNANNTITLDIFRPNGVLIMSGLYHSKYKKFTPNQSPVPNISLFSPGNQIAQKISLDKNLPLLSERFLSLQVNKLMGNSGGGGSTDNPEDECPPGTICLDDVIITAPTPQPPNDDPGVDIPDLPPAGPIDYFPTDPTIPTGNETSSEPPTIEVKQDSLQKYYPCMVKEVLKKLESNQTYGKLVQPFQKIQLPNGTTLGMQGLPNLKYDFSAQDYGVGTNNYSLGTTGDYAGTSSTIRFNTAAMTNASQLLLQATAIHETGHAYANYYIKAGQYGFPVDTTRYSTWAINIVNFESVAKSSAQGGGNFNDHSIFLEEYFENFLGILKAVNGNAYTDKEYQMAALFGLNNPGPAPQSPVIGGVNVYEIYKGMLTQSFNNIKTKYGITDAELNTFNLANLKNVLANKKLPATCP